MRFTKAIKEYFLVHLFLIGLVASWFEIARYPLLFRLYLSSGIDDNIPGGVVFVPA